MENCVVDLAADPILQGALIFAGPYGACTVCVDRPLALPAPSLWPYS